jgi:hypothetical protein
VCQRMRKEGRMEESVPREEGKKEARTCANDGNKGRKEGRKERTRPAAPLPPRAPPGARNNQSVRIFQYKICSP